MAKLKDGRRPLAIALSSDAGDADDGNNDDKGATEAKTGETLRGEQASLVMTQKNIAINLWVNW